MSRLRPRLGSIRWLGGGSLCLGWLALGMGAARADLRLVRGEVSVEAGALLPPLVIPTVERQGVRVVKSSDLARLAGGTRYWRPDVRKVVIRVGEHRLKLTMDSRFAVLDDEPFSLRLPAAAVDGEPAVPVWEVPGLLTALTGERFGWDGQEIELPAAFDPPVEVPRVVGSGVTGDAGSPAVAARGLRRVVLDAGHGGSDSGVVGAGGVREKDLTIDLVRRLARRLQSLGLEVVLTREGDSVLGPEERAARANAAAADLLVSIHVNGSFGNEAAGFEVYRSANIARGAPAKPQDSLAEMSFVPWDRAQAVHDEAAGEAARAISLAIAQDLKLENRGVIRADLPLLRTVDLPAVLVELGFLTNPDDYARLIDRRFRDRAARALAKGIAIYAGDEERP